MRPMLAGKFDPNTCTWPKIASSKLDGIRMIVEGGVGMSRSLKVIPNTFVQDWVWKYHQSIEGLDGELIVGPPNAPDVYRRTNSGVMSKDGQPDFAFYVFDDQSHPKTTYRMRRPEKMPSIEIPRLVIHQHTLCRSLEELDILEAAYLEQGYEGVMLRDPMGLYKEGRSTTREGWLIKVKRFEDGEAKIIGFEEEMANNNVLQLNELGRAKRSSHQENKVGKGTLGALICLGTSVFPGIKFNVGSGFDAAERAVLWDTREDLIGQEIKFKFFSVGVKDAPRHPVFLGMRND
jgi:DNA ligase-1